MKLSDVDNLVWLSEMIESGRAAKLRRDAGLSQGDIGTLCDATAAAVSLWENGNRRPRGQRALRYAEVLRRLERVEQPA